MCFQLQILNFAEIEATESILFHNGDSTKFRKIGCFAWVLRKNDEIIMIDTGIKDIDVVNRTRVGPKSWIQKSEQTIENNLERLRINHNDVKTVILTHSHYDHISNLPLFGNADVYMSIKEYQYFYEEEKNDAVHLEEVKGHLNILKENQKLYLVENSRQINKQITVQWVGGHTPGSQILFADTDIGKCLITGDAVFLKDNIKNKIPIGLTTSYDQSFSVLELCRDFSGICLPSHDLSVLSHFARN